MPIAATTSYGKGVTTATPGGTLTTTASLSAAITGSASASSKVTGSTGSQVQFGTLAHPWAANSPWNIPIPANPALDPNSAAIVNTSIVSVAPNRFVGLLGPYGFGVPIYTATPSTPRVNLSVKAYSRTTPMDPSWTSNGTSDGKIAVIDPVEGVMYDINGYSGNNKSTWAVYHSYKTSLADGNVPMSEGRGTSGSACTVLSGIITLADLASGSIEHAIAAMTASPAKGQNRYPATQNDGTYTGANAICEGMRIQLDPALNVNTVANASVLEKMIMRAMQKYGVIIVDNGGNNNQSISCYVEKPKTNFGQSDPYPSYGLTQDYYPMRHIPYSSFRILDASVTYQGMPAPANGVTYG